MPHTTDLLPLVTPTAKPTMVHTLEHTLLHLLPWHLVELAGISALASLALTVAIAARSSSAASAPHSSSWAAPPPSRWTTPAHPGTTRTTTANPDAPAGVAARHEHRLPTSPEQPSDYI